MEILPVPDVPAVQRSLSVERRLSFPDCSCKQKPSRQVHDTQRKPPVAALSAKRTVACRDLHRILSSPLELDAWDSI
jgi:hypothetical protein